MLDINNIPNIILYINKYPLNKLCTRIKYNLYMKKKLLRKFIIVRFFNNYLLKNEKQLTSNRLDILT